MSLDIIEIALDKITDDQEFEKLATEVLYNEGYYDIKPMPGGNDFGQDAIEDKFYESSGAIRTVFQYSLQGYSKGKIEKTIVRLREVNIIFSELVYVTNKMISGEKQEILKQTIRKDFGIPMTIFEKETFATRLSDLSNGIFARRFPQIENQIAALKSNKPRISEEAGKSLEIALLKVSIAFTFNKDANKARKDIFDNLLLSLIYDSNKSSLTLDDIINKYKTTIGLTSFNEEQIKAALSRLKSENQIVQEGASFTITSQATKKLEASNILANQFTDALLEDIYSNVSSVSSLTF